MLMRFMYVLKLCILKKRSKFMEFLLNTMVLPFYQLTISIYPWGTATPK